MGSLNSSDKKSIESNETTMNPSATPASRPEWEVTRDTRTLSAQVTDTAKSAGQAVTEQATELVTDIGHELSKTAEAQKTRGVEALRHFAHAMDGAAAELEGQSPKASQSIHTAAQKVEQLSDTLGNRGVDGLLRDATDLARSQPVLFFGGAVAAGFALARFLKSSAMHRPAAEERSQS
jgi:hypothetical protein